MQYAICNHYHFVHGDILVLFHGAFACYHSFFGCMVLAKFTNVLLNSPTSLSTSPKKITYKNSVCHLPFTICHLLFAIYYSTSLKYSLCHRLDLLIASNFSSLLRTEKKAKTITRKPLELYSFVDSPCCRVLCPLHKSFEPLLTIFLIYNFDGISTISIYCVPFHCIFIIYKICLIVDLLFSHTF